MNYLVPKKSVRATIASLQAGQTLNVAFEDVAPTYIRNCCSILGDALGYRFKVHKDNEQRIYIVTRTA